MVKRNLTRFAAVSLLFANFAWAQDAVQVSYTPLSCIPKSCNGAKIEAKATAAPVAAVRVYFHSDADPTDYYLDMRPGSQPGDYWAVLPLVADGTKNVTYYVAAIDPTGRVYTGAPATVPVSNNCSNPALTEEQARFGRNLAIGLKESNQSPAPAGFRCWGVVSQITATGEMRPNEECRQAVVRNHETDPCFMPLGKAAGLVLAGAAAGVGVAVIHENNHEPPKPISPARP